MPDEKKTLEEFVGEFWIKKNMISIDLLRRQSKNVSERINGRDFLVEFAQAVAAFVVREVVPQKVNLAAFIDPADAILAQRMIDIIHERVKALGVPLEE